MLDAASVTTFGGTSVVKTASSPSLVPVAFFAGAVPSDYVYLYSALSGCESGYEEWGLREGGPAPDTVPAPAGAVALVGLAAFARRRR